MPLISMIVLALLLAAWGWVLGRPLLQSLLTRSQRDPVGHFNRQLSVLGSAPTASMNSMSPIAPMGLRPGRSAMKRRRLQWFLALVMAVLVSFVLAVVFGGVFVWQHLLLDVLLVAYIGLAARMGAIERERATKVTSLRVAGTSGRPSYLEAVGER